MSVKKLLFLMSVLLFFLVGAWRVHRSFFSLEAKLDNYIKVFVAQGNFSGSVLVAKDGKILLCKGYGMANYELGIPNTPQTKFRICSITKTFTAMAIMMLVERKLLQINDALSKFFSDYPIGNKITIQQLLTHTSGIPNYTLFPDYKMKRSLGLSVTDVIDRVKKESLNFTSGKKFEYSNSGYVLLSKIIEIISGKSYEDFLKEDVFLPLAMHNTGQDNHRLILKQRAAGYSLKNGILENSDYITVPYILGDGVLYSTILDLYQWNRALHANKFINKSSYDKMHTAFVRMPDQWGENYTYGYGWIISDLLGHKLIHHPGGIDGGFSGEFYNFIDDDLSIIILSNVEGTPVAQISNDLAAIVFDQKK